MDAAPAFGHPGAMDLTGIKAVLPDHEVRPVVMSDVPAIVDLVERITTHVLGESDANEAEIRDDLTGAHFDLAADTFIALSPDGRVTGYGLGMTNATAPAGWMSISTHDLDSRHLRHRGRRCGCLVCWAHHRERHARAACRRVKLTANLYETEVPMRTAYERAGLEIETVYWRMILKFDVAGELERSGDSRGLRDSQASIPMTTRSWHSVTRSSTTRSASTMASETAPPRSRTTQRTGAPLESYDPSAWWFAYKDDELVGMMIGDNRRVEQGYGYVKAIGVRKSERGQGVARALLLTAFAHWRDVGLEGVQLGVDTGNVTEATRLYESVGMTSLHSAIALAKDVTL